jgi:hypothetical protein
VNEIDYIKRLDSAANLGPEVDIADGVMRRIRSQQIPIADSRPMWAAVLLSGLAAIIVAGIALQTFANLQDPMGDLFTPVWTTFQ